MEKTRQMIVSERGYDIYQLSEIARQNKRIKIETYEDVLAMLDRIQAREHNHYDCTIELRDAIDERINSIGAEGPVEGREKRRRAYPGYERVKLEPEIQDG